MKRLVLAAACACVSLCTYTGSAFSAPLDGTFALAGLANVRVGTDYIDWGQTGGIFGPTAGDVLFTSATDSFAGLTGTAGKLSDLTNPPALVGAPINIPNFLVALAQPTWDFTLTYIPLGEGTNAGCFDGNPLTNCTPTGSPFTIVDVGANAAVSLVLQGTVMDMVGPVSQWQAIYTTQFTDASAASILARLAAMGYVESSHSSEWDVGAAIPEPSMMLLMGTGLALLSRARSRRRDA